MNILENMNQTKRIWLSVIAGFLAFLILLLPCHFGWSLFWGIVVGVIAYIVLGWFTGRSRCETASAPQGTENTPSNSTAPRATGDEQVQTSVSRSEPASNADLGANEEAPQSESGESESAQPEVKTAVSQADTDKSVSDQEQQPEILSAPRAGGADDLKQIKGVGPKLEGVLNELGFWHFDQIAAWTDDEVSWVDNRLKFKGRIARDNWIEQAKDLAKQR